MIESDNTVMIWKNIKINYLGLYLKNKNYVEFNNIISICYTFNWRFYIVLGEFTVYIYYLFYLYVDIVKVKTMGSIYVYNILCSIPKQLLWFL